MKRLSYTLSVFALAAAGPVMADTSAEEVWAEWQEQAALSGQTLTADLTETDTGLTLTNILTLIDDGAALGRGEMDEVVLTENADGTVTMTFSQPYSISFAVDPASGSDQGMVELLIFHENLSVVASGTTEERTYAYSADAISMEAGDITSGSGDDPVVDLDFVISDLAASYMVTGAEGEDAIITSDASIGGMRMILDVQGPPSEPGNLKVGLQMGASSSTSSTTMLSAAAMNQTPFVAPDNFALDADLTYESFALEMLFESPDDAFSMVYSNTGGTMGVAFSEDGMGFNVGSTGASATVTARDLPVPLTASIGSSEIAMSMPMFAGEAPQDISMRVALQNLVLGETAYGMFDPTGAIPRDPASLIFDATGQLQMFMDLMNIDPEVVTGPPAEFRAITVNELSLSVGGAELSGTADLTFAPNQLIPMPVGQADLQLSGGTALMDALVAGGLVPPAQSGMIMGMANVFARPGAAPDTLETTVEFGANGSITANGVPLQ